MFCEPIQKVIGYILQLFTVGVTPGVNKNLLKDISSSPQTEGKNFFTSPDFSHIDTLVEEVRAGACETDPIVTGRYRV